jgi:UDP-2,3-diacylglucosamine pyrophosphatase LpxH
MSKKAIGIAIALGIFILACGMMVWIDYFHGKKSETEQSSLRPAPDNKNEIISSFDENKESNTKYSRTELQQRRLRRHRAIAQLMEKMSNKSADEIGEQMMQELMEQAQISDEELHRMEVRNAVIGPHVWTKGESVYDSIISEQETDDEWTENNLKAFENAILEQPQLASKMVKLECFETMCRGVFHHRDEEDMNQFRDLTATSVINGPSQAFVKKNEDGSIDTRIYFAHVGDDALLFDEMHDRLYEKITGQSVAEMNL